MTIHHVFANRSNVGDWLSARGIQALLAPERVVEHLCDDPFVPETPDGARRPAVELFLDAERVGVAHVGGSTNPSTCPLFRRSPRFDSCS